MNAFISANIHQRTKKFIMLFYLEHKKDNLTSKWNCHILNSRLGWFSVLCVCMNAYISVFSHHSNIKFYMIFNHDHRKVNLTSKTHFHINIWRKMRFSIFYVCMNACNFAIIHHSTIKFDMMLYHGHTQVNLTSKSFLSWLNLEKIIFSILYVSKNACYSAITHSGIIKFDMMSYLDHNNVNLTSKTNFHINIWKKLNFPY